MSAPAGKRRIDRVTDPTLLERLSELSTADLRSLRDECREEESRLSYHRRLLQGRCDIVQAEVERRGSGADGDLQARLAAVLSDRTTTRGTPRAVSVTTPPEDPERREEDALVSDAALAGLPDLDEEGLRALVERLTDGERAISEQRAVVLRHLDALQDELVARYRDGRADISDMLSGA